MKRDPGSDGSPPGTSLTDAELIGRMAGGSLSASRELYRRLSPLSYSLALRITGRAEDAEEALIDAFVQAWAQADRYDPARATAEGWILNITRSRAIDLVRSRRRWDRDRQETARSIATFPDRAGPDPESEAIRSEERSRLREAIAALGEDQRRAVELAYFGGLSHAEIARQIAQPLGTVKTRLRLAMEKIRRALSGVDRKKP